MRVRACLAALVSLVLVAIGGPVAVTGAEPLHLELEGRPILLDEVPRYHCHDVEAPLIHCFRSEADLRDSVARYTAEIGAAAGVTATAYVRAYADATFGGSSFTFSSDYTNLGAIGWNDRISSYVSLNCGAGEFREHSGYAGFRYAFSCGDQVTYVGDAYNDRFSSVRRGS